MLHFSVLSAADVDRCHELGVSVFAWTVDERSCCRAPAGQSVDGVITNDPRIFDASGEPRRWSPRSVGWRYGMRRLAVFSALGLAAVAALVPVVHGQEELPPGIDDRARHDRAAAPAPEPAAAAAAAADPGRGDDRLVLRRRSERSTRRVSSSRRRSPSPSDRPKRLSWLVAPTRLGARAHMEAALSQALAAPPGSQVHARRDGTWPGDTRYVSKLGQRVNRQPKDRGFVS